MTGLGREPTADEIAEVTGIEPEEVASIKHSAQAPTSLQKPVGDEDQSEFGQLIADEQAESPYERAVEILTNEALRDALENLSYRERRVLELRYGLNIRNSEKLRGDTDLARYLSPRSTSSSAPNPASGPSIRNISIVRSGSM